MSTEDWQKEYTKEYRKEYYRIHKEQLLISAAAYRIKNWEKIKPKMVQKVKEWRKNNLEKFREQVKRLTAKKILKRDAERMKRPDLYYQTKKGYWRKIRAKMSEAERLQRSKDYREKLKSDPVYIAMHRQNALNYWRRKQLQKKREALIYFLAGIVNRHRIKQEKIKLLQ